MNNPKILALGSALLGRHQFARGHSRWDHRTYPGFTGDVAQALRPFPQYHILWRNVPTGNSIYHALEVVLQQRFAHALQVPRRLNLFQTE